MIDLEELFQPIVDESRAAREPVGLIEARARRRTAGRRARRRVATAVTVVALSVGAAVAVRSAVDDRHQVPASNTTLTTTGREAAALRSALRSAVRAAPYHVFAPTSPALILEHAESDRAMVGGSEVYQVNLFYRAAHGQFHVWMAERSWAASIIGDLATVGQPTNIAGTVWHLQTLPRGAGLPTLQLARGTKDGAVIEVDGNFDLHTMSALTASLR